MRLTADSARAIFSDYDVVLDCTDNFAARYVINDTCVALGIPEVWAAVFRTAAQVSVFWPAMGGPQLRDLFPTEPDARANAEVIGAGVLGAMTGVVGSMMAAEAIKLITGTGEPLIGRVAYVDTLGARVTEIPLRPSH